MKVKFNGEEFTSTDGLFNLVTARKVPRPGGDMVEPGAVLLNEPWESARKLVRITLDGIGKPGGNPWDGGAIVDAWLEQVEIRRPWSVETFEAYRRELIRAQDLAHDNLTAENAHMRRKLRGTIGLTHAGVLC